MTNYDSSVENRLARMFSSYGHSIEFGSQCSSSSKIIFRSNIYNKTRISKICPERVASIQKLLGMTILIKITKMSQCVCSIYKYFQIDDLFQNGYFHKKSRYNTPSIPLCLFGNVHVLFMFMQVLINNNPNEFMFVCEN